MDRRAAISPNVRRYAAGILQLLGYAAPVHLVPHDQLDAPLETIQEIAGAWGDTSYGMFATWFACHGPNVHGWACDRRIDRQLRRAQSLLPNGACSPTKSGWARSSR